jgi:serine/threonine protein kinase
MRPLRPGDPTEIGGYQLRAYLGKGGMGTVYLASTRGGRLVAVKSIRSELAADEEFQERFRLEIRAARRVRGLYTAELIDADPDAIPPWLVTAYVPGSSLAEAVKAQGPVPPELVPLLVAGVAEALIDIHSAGIVHRDLKPSNVLLSQDGPRVIDFGIAKALDNARLTMSGVTMGSPECMTPEQVRGEPVTPAADVFSLGSLGAYAVSGRPPFDAPNSAAMMYRVVHDAPVIGDCPAQLRQLLESCLAKEPGDRPTTAQVLDRCRALMSEEPAVFPRWWAPGAAGEMPDVTSASGRVPPAFDEPSPPRNATARAPRSKSAAVGRHVQSAPRPTPMARLAALLVGLLAALMALWFLVRPAVSGNATAKVTTAPTVRAPSPAATAKASQPPHPSPSTPYPSPSTPYPSQSAPPSPPSRQPNQAPAVTLPTPAGWWKLFETSDSVGTDSAGDHPAAGSNISWCPVGNCANFSGHSDFVTQGPVLRTGPGASFTVTAWVWMYGVPANGGSMSFVSQDGAAESGFYLQYVSQNNGSWSFSRVTNDTKAPGIYRAVSDAPAAIQKWTFLAGVFNGVTGQMQLYVNGVLQHNTATDPTAFRTGGDFVIGRSQDNGNQDDWVLGSMGNVVAYNKALTGPQVKLLMSMT